MSDWSTVKTRFKMPAYSVGLNPHSSASHAALVESGDKILLPTHILANLMGRFGDRTIGGGGGGGGANGGPWIFEIQNVATRRISHCGVLEFNHTQSIAFLPQWMMSNLGLSEKDEVSIRLKDLPVGTELVLQPLSWEFGLIPTPKVALEHALRGFTALTVGDNITIRVGGKPHSLIVKEIRPQAKMPSGQPNACCVVDAHLAVDFLPPLEVEPEDSKPIELSLDVPQRGSTLAGTYKYYRIKTIDPHAAVEIQVRTIEGGDTELVVSTVNNKPDLTACIWQSVQQQPNTTTSAPPAASSSSSSSSLPHDPSLTRLTISPTSIGFIAGWYYIGVFAYKVDSTFEVCVREVTHVDESMNSKSSNGSTGMAAGSSTSTDPTAKKCESCRAWVSAKAMPLHSAQCARMNIFCEQCQKPIRKSELPSHAHCELCQVLLHPSSLSKHMDLVHTKVPCPDCGLKFEPGFLQNHRTQDCFERLEMCKFCMMQLPYRLKEEHQTFCGATSDACQRCGKMIPRRRMDIHLAVDHGINLSLKPGDRTNMGSNKPMMTAAQYADQQRQAAAFQHKIDPESQQPLPPPPLTEEEAIERAIAASMGQDLDADLLAVMEESRKMATPAIASDTPAPPASASSSSAPPPSNTTIQPPPQPAPSHHATRDEEEDDFHDEDMVVDDEVDDDGDDGGANWSDDEDGAGSTAPSNQGCEELCPCGKGFRNFTALSEHMETCQDMDS